MQRVGRQHWNFWNIFSLVYFVHFIRRFDFQVRYSLCNANAKAASFYFFIFSGSVENSKYFWYFIVDAAAEDTNCSFTRNKCISVEKANNQIAKSVYQKWCSFHFYVSLFYGRRIVGEVSFRIYTHARIIMYHHYTYAFQIQSALSKQRHWIGVWDEEVFNSDKDRTNKLLSALATAQVSLFLVLCDIIVKLAFLDESRESHF